MSCPRCGSPRTVAGRLNGGNIMLHFTPNAGFTWRAFFRRLFYVENPSATVCANCGLLWMEFPVEALANKIRRWGTPEARAWLEGGAPERLRGERTRMPSNDR